MRLARLLAPQVAALLLCVKKWFLRALQIRLCAKCFNVVKHLKRAEMAYSLAVRRNEPPPYGGRIVVISSEVWCDADPTLGLVAAGGLEVHAMPGSHDVFMTTDDQVQAVASLLRPHIEKAQQKA